MERDERRLILEQAYRDHAADVYRVAYAILRSPDLAQDATQETFARAFERWHQYDPARPITPWLHRIAANLALDGIRRHRLRAFLTGRSLNASPNVREIEVADPSNPDPATTVGSRQVAEAALACLKPRARAAIVLRHWHGYDYVAIAEILGTTPGTVGALLSRAHADMRARLDATADARTTGRRGAPRPADSSEVTK